MLSAYRHISFDLDGTLVHSVPEYRRWVVPKVVEELAGKIQNQQSIDKFWFESGRDTTIRDHFNLEPALFWERFKVHDTPNERSRHTHPYDDAETALRALKAHGKLISILTGSPRWIANMEIEKLNGAPYDFHISLADSPFPLKPDPASFIHALERLDVSPKETVYIGNSNEDAQYARNAGVDFIYLERKEHPFDHHNYSIATITSLHQLL